MTDMDMTNVLLKPSGHIETMMPVRRALSCAMLI